MNNVAGPLTVVDRDGRQSRIESNYLDVKEYVKWDDAYVSFSGFFGGYGPDVFAAAPELREALLNFVKVSRNPDSVDRDFDRAEELAFAALAKAKSL